MDVSYGSGVDTLLRRGRQIEESLCWKCSLFQDSTLTYSFAVVCSCCVYMVISLCVSATDEKLTKLCVY